MVFWTSFIISITSFSVRLAFKLYEKKIKSWKSKGYEIIIYYLKLPSVEIAIERVKLRVAEGGHNVPEKDIRRRFERSWINFQEVYKSLVDSWTVFDSSGQHPVSIENSEK
jgi:predicted ABC-type ATPase